MEQRFIRNIPAISPEEQAVLGKKCAAVIGCGGLGGFITEFLARSGIGGLILVDGDSFEESNLNRQCLALPSTLGQNKALAAAARAGAINSSIKLRAFPEHLCVRNADSLLEGADIVMDGLDSIEARLLLEDICADKKLELIHGAVAGWTAQVCAVAPGSGTLHRLYANVPGSGDKSVLTHVPALCSALQCALALKALCGRLTEEDRRLLLADSLGGSFFSIPI